MLLLSVPTHAAGEPLTIPGLRAADALALARVARSLAAGAAPMARPLEGRFVAVVAGSQDQPSAGVFALAAQALGARVAHIAPADLGLGLGDAANAQDTARLLGRLYAAIGCAGLDMPSVALLKLTCGVPVLHDLAADIHPSRLLADLMTLQQAQCEGVARPPRRPRLGLHGAPRSSLLQAWQEMAAGAGVELIDLSGRGAAARSAGCDFVCRPGPPPELLAVAVAAGTSPYRHQESSLWQRQRSNHALVVQALLLNELGARR